MGVLTKHRTRTQEFERIALVYVTELLRVARRVCGDATQAEDLVQETYLRAWKFWERFEPGTNCRAWLYKIMFNVFRSSRTKAGRVTVSIERPEIGRVLPFTPPPSITMQAVGTAFDQLTEEYRSALLLVAVEGFSYKEAAEILDVPIGTIMSRIHRGRAALRELVEGKEPTRKSSSSSAGSRNAL